MSQILVYTDGACSGNPGPCGIGIAIETDDQVVLISRFIGHGTNNHAELMAINEALGLLPTDYESEIRVHTDSAWAIGVLTGWKAKTNLDLVADTKRKLQRFGRLSLVKVKGHADCPGNLVVDRLAVRAAKTGQSSVEKRPK